MCVAGKKRAPNKPMKLLSWNIRQGGGTRREKICAALKEHQPDIVTLQEYRRNAAGREIAERLNKMGLNHQYAAETKAEKDNTIFIASHLPFQAGNFMGEDAVPDIIEASFDIDGKNLILLAVHFPQKKPQIPLFDAIADDSAGLLAEKCILIGDLNCGVPFEDSDSKTFYATRQFQKLLSIGWVDAWRSRHKEAKEFTWTSVRTGNRFRYDQCLASEGANLEIQSIEYDHTVREQNISDHSLIVCELVI